MGKILKELMPERLKNGHRIYLSDGENTWGEVTERGWLEAYLSSEEIETINDGYHSFKELYRHRAVLFAVLSQNYDSWKSRLHYDGTMYDGMFITGVNTKFGPVSYHIENEFWDLFNVKELKNAPEWDGCSPDEGLERLIKDME